MVPLGKGKGLEKQSRRCHKGRGKVQIFVQQWNFGCPVYDRSSDCVEHVECVRCLQGISCPAQHTKALWTNNKVTVLVGGGGIQL